MKENVSGCFFSEHSVQLKSVILEQRMENERSFMQLCRVVGDLAIVPFGSESWLSGLVGGKIEWMRCCGFCRLLKSL